MSEKYRYPHESIARTGTVMQRAAKELINLDLLYFHLLQYVPPAYASLLPYTRLQEWGQRSMYKAYNGEVGSDILPEKIKFTELVREMGYSAPASILFKKGQDSSQILQHIIDLDTQLDLRFCKPTNGNQGKGTKLVNTPEEAATFVASKNKDYLVQTAEIPQQDWRYVIHQASPMQGVEDSWRIAYEKVRPTVIGDGESSVGDLVKKDEVIPSYAKRKYRKKAKKEAKSYIPQQGEEMVIVDTGNISKGSYGRLGTEEELTNLDKFMGVFLHDLEQKLGGKLNVMCVDIGVKDSSVLTGEYDFDKLQQNIVFYEFQVPFGMDGYTYSVNDEQRREMQQSFRANLLKLKITKYLLTSGAWTPRKKE